MTLWRSWLNWPNMTVTMHAETNLAKEHWPSKPRFILTFTMAIVRWVISSSDPRIHSHSQKFLLKKLPKPSYSVPELAIRSCWFRMTFLSLLMQKCFLVKRNLSLSDKMAVRFFPACEWHPPIVWHSEDFLCGHYCLWDWWGVFKFLDQDVEAGRQTGTIFRHDMVWFFQYYGWNTVANDPTDHLSVRMCQFVDQDHQQFACW